MLYIVAHAGLPHAHVAGGVLQYAPFIVGAVVFAVAQLVARYREGR